MTDSPAVEIPDDLEAFSDLFYGKAKPEVEDPVEVEEEITEDEVSEEVEDLEDETDAPASEDDDDEADPEEDEDPAEEDEKPQRRNRKTAKERIQEVVAEREAALRELAIEREVSRRLKEANELKPAEEKADTKEVEAPNPDAVNDKGESLYPLGEFDAGYIRALHRFTADQELARTERLLEERRVQAEQVAQRQKQQQDWGIKLEAVEKEYPDVREKIATLDHLFEGIEPTYGQYLVDVIQSLDNGPILLRYLADHEQEARQIVSAGHTAATLSLGRLDAQIASSRVQKEKVAKVTKAPVPPKAAPRGNGGKFTVAADTDDLDAFEKMFFTPKKR